MMNGLVLQRTTGDTINDGVTTGVTHWVDELLRSLLGPAVLVECAWVGGFMDGEGCFKGCKWVNRRKISPCAQVSQTESNREVLDRVAQLIGGTFSYRPARGRSRPHWSLRLTGDRARQAAALLRPFLMSDKLNAIDLWDTPNPRYGGRRGS